MYGQRYLNVEMKVRFVVPISEDFDINEIPHTKVAISKYIWSKNNITKNTPAIPPIAPSIDLFGLIFGESLLLKIFPPIAFPTKYAEMSHAHISINVINTRTFPFGNSYLISRIYENKYATYIIPNKV